MILGVPFALLASLWLAWNAGATADGDPTIWGLVITLAIVIAAGGRSEEHTSELQSN